MITTVRELAALIGGDIEGSADISISGVASVTDARPGDVVLADNERFFELAAKSDASCIIAGRGMNALNNGKAVIRVDNAAEAFVGVLEFFREKELQPEAGIGPGAVVEKDVSLGANVAVGANCYIGSGTIIGDGCVLFPNVCIGNDVQIGEGCRIYPGTVIYSRCKIGNRVILHAGVVIGADGFGYTCSGQGLTKYPHAGTVEIGDDVEIGANSAIDRAKTGATVIGKGTKIDNLVHIAHNVKIGESCVIVALSGVAGSVEIGNGVTLAAQTGVKDHVRIEDGAVVAARAGVIGNVSKGSVVSGFPARDHHLEKRVEAARLHLPEILQRIRALEDQLRELRGRGDSESNDSSGD